MNKDRSVRATVGFAILLLIPSGCGNPKVTVAHDRPLGYWIEGLQGADVKLRRQAAKILGNIGPADATVVPALSGAVNDPDPVVRKEAILSLSKFGPSARDALPALEKAGRDKDAKIREHAAKAIAAITRSE